MIKGKKIIYDKYNPRKEMNYIDYGVSIIKNRVFKNYSTKKNFDLADLFNKLCLKEKIAYTIVKKRFYEIGSYKGIEDFKKYIKNKQ